MPFVRLSTKELEETNGKSCTCRYRELNQATRPMMPSERQKAKGLWATKAARDRDEEFCDRLAKKIF